MILDTKMKLNLETLPSIKNLLDVENDRSGSYNLVVLIKNGVTIHHYEEIWDKNPHYIENPQFKLLVSQLEYNAVRDLEYLQKITIEDDKVISIYLVMNKLTPLPESIVNLVNLQSLNIEHNCLNGSFSQNDEKTIEKLKEQGCKLNLLSFQEYYKSHKSARVMRKAKIKSAQREIVKIGSRRKK